MLTVELNRNEYDYLCQALFLGSVYRELFCSGVELEGKYLLKIPEDHADEIRDLCGEQLQISGFDEAYELTFEGMILESLIDKLFIG